MKFFKYIVFSLLLLVSLMGMGQGVSASMAHSEESTLINSPTYEIDTTYKIGDFTPVSCNNCLRDISISSDGSRFAVSYGLNYGGTDRKESGSTVIYKYLINFIQ